ncbi:MAG: DUF3592 domain-containing protein [Haloarcula sp.]
MLSGYRWLGVAVALTLIAVGSGLAVSQYQTVTSYETTTGVVERAELDVSTVLADWGEEGRYYQPDVVYTYTVGGEAYTGRTVAYATELVTGSRARAAGVLSAFTVGESTTVYYDPGEPSNAHLIPRVDFFPAGVLVVAGLILLADAVTARSRWVHLLRSLPLDVRNRLPLLPEDPSAGDADDPAEIVESQSPTAGGEALVSGKRARAVWFLCLLGIVDTLVLYGLATQRPYDISAAAMVLVLFAGAGRLVFVTLSGDSAGTGS